MNNLKINRLIKTHRKTVYISITRQAEIVVRAPLHLTDRSISDIVNSKKEWIIRKLDGIKPSPKKLYIPGETFLFLGSDYTLRTTEEIKNIEINGVFLEISENYIHKAKEILTGWYKKQAGLIIPERLSVLAAQNGFRYSSIKISSARKRWGSCGARGKLNFTWRLVMCPVEIIDYVIVHELSHIEICNHSQKFWDKVESIMPDYREKDRWLRINSDIISF